MNRSELVEKVESATGLDKRQAENAVKAVVDAVTSVIKAGEKVSIFGFGTFAPTSRAARVGRNPQTGASVNIAASTGVRFAPATALKALLNPKPVKKGAGKKAAAAGKKAAAAPAKKTAPAAKKTAPAPAAAPAKKTAAAAKKTAPAAKKIAPAAKKTAVPAKAAPAPAKKAPAAKKTAAVEKKAAPAKKSAKASKKK